MSPRRFQRIGGAAREVGRGSKRRMRALRARDHTTAGLVLFLIALFLSALALALTTGRCNTHRPVSA
jgi:hypothetical protein